MKFEMWSVWHFIYMLSPFTIFAIIPVGIVLALCVGAKLTIKAVKSK